MPENAETLPTVTAVEVLPGKVARLTIQGGEVLTVSPDTTPRAFLIPQTAYGSAVLTLDWRSANAPAYFVPAVHVDALAQLFNPPAQRKPVELLRPLPTLTHIEALADGAARLTLDSGRTLEVTPEENAALSGEEYTPRLLALFDENDCLCIVPDALAPAVLKFLHIPGGQS